MSTIDTPTKEELLLADCWEPRTDTVPGDPETTRFRQEARLQQARWRDSRGYAEGGRTSSQAYIPMGSRLHPDAADKNYLTDHIRAAAKTRFPGAPTTSRLRTDLLSSMPMCFNLFGELWNRPAEATKAVRMWFSDLPGEVRELRFEWSPGRQHPGFLGDNTAFDASFHLELETGKSGIVGIETKYHEWASPEDTPTSDNLQRYEEITERSGVFNPEWRAKILAGPLQQIWRDHLLLLSMLQHPSGAWGWGRYVLVYPSQNASFRNAAGNYREVLAEQETFVPLTVEELLDGHVLPKDAEEAFSERYLW